VAILEWRDFDGVDPQFLVIDRTARQPNEHRSFQKKLGLPA
jgi:hypothetical protein